MCHNTLIHTDHSIISFNLQFETLLPNLTNARSVLNYSNADWDGLSSYLFDTDFSDCFQSSDIEFVWNTIKNKIYDAIDLFIPKLNHRARQFPKWFTAKLRHRLNCVRTLKRKVKLHPSEKLKIKIKSKESALLYDLTFAKADFETNLIKHFEHRNTSMLYKYITGHNTIPDLVK